MRKVIFILATIFLSTTAFAEVVYNNNYETAFQDGTISTMSDDLENEISDAYDILIKIETIRGEKADEIKNLLIKKMTTHLGTLGIMIEDIESGNAVSSRLYKHLKKEDERIGKGFEEALGKEKASTLQKESDLNIIKFWKKLKKEREEKNWKVEYKTEKIKTHMEKQINLALDTLIKYGNVFKIE